jgi:hypothetical protein
MMIKMITLSTRQISATLDKDLVRFLDETTANRSAAISEALEQWRDLQWQRRLAAAYAELNEAGALALSRRLPLVTFDRNFQRYTDLDALLLSERKEG